MKRWLLMMAAGWIGCLAVSGCDNGGSDEESSPSVGGIGAGGTSGGSSSGNPVGSTGNGTSSGASGTDTGSDSSGSGTETDTGGNTSPSASPCGGSQVHTNPGFKNLAPPMGAPLDPAGTAVTPTPPAGWVWYQIDGAVCRDGSPAGFYVRYKSSKKLLFYLEGGGACTSPGFCNYNPASADQVLIGDVETPLGSAFGAGSGRQQPGTAGIFDVNNNANPVRDWNMIYVPYCTGDVHFGSKQNSTVPGVSQPQQFVGHLNMLKFVSRIVPTFRDKVDQVLLTGSSAGGFGASLNYSMVQDAFGSICVQVVDDSGPPFADRYFPVCMQKKWRALWGLDDSLPADCAECRQADGGGLARLGEFMIRKHPNLTVGLVSSLTDEIIRLFYSAGNNNCSNFETSDMIGNFLGVNGGMVPADVYTAGLTNLCDQYISNPKNSAYFMSGGLHQHLWRPRFYEAPTGGMTIAKWLIDFINGTGHNLKP